MTRFVRTIASSVAFVVIGALSADVWAAGVETRHSGTVVAVDPEKGSVTLEEIVTWTGPGTGAVTRSVSVTPRTSMQLVVRDRDPDSASMPGFEESPITLARVRDGDFITITTRADEPIAVSLEVYRPDNTLRQ